MGVLKVKVNGVWQDVNYGGPNEVYIDTADPLGLDASAELWVDTNTVPPMLKANVGGVWVDVSSATPEEVVISPDDPILTNPEAELWFDSDAVVIGAGANDEIFIGPDDPAVSIPTVELWVDTDEPDPLPVAMPAVMLKAAVHAHHIYSGSKTWTWRLAAGSYLCTFCHSAVAASNGLRTINLQMDGVDVNQSKFYFNLTGTHLFMNQGVTEVVIPSDGDYGFSMVVGGSLSIDANDFGWMTLIPAAPGVVH
jgi:hypothetical protein